MSLLAAATASGCLGGMQKTGESDQAMSAQSGEWIYQMTIEPMEPDEFLLNQWVNKPPGPWPMGPFRPPTLSHMRFGTGFPRDLETPIFQFDRARRNRAGQERPLAHVYDAALAWLVSDSLRETLLNYDANAFDMIECRTQFPNGETGPRYWLTDIIRVCECVDRLKSLEAGSKTSTPHGWIVINYLNADKVFFLSEPLQGGHFFQVPTSIGSVFCTRQAREFLLTAGFDDFTFREVGRIS